MLYLIIYSVFAYLIIIGEIIAEVAMGIKPSRWHIIFLVLAPLFLPVYVGYWMGQVMNLGAPKPQDNINVKP